MAERERGAESGRNELAALTGRFGAQLLQHARDRVLIATPHAALQSHGQRGGAKRLVEALVVLQLLEQRHVARRRLLHALLQLGRRAHRHARRRHADKEGRHVRVRLRQVAIERARVAERAQVELELGEHEQRARQLRIGALGQVEQRHLLKRLGLLARHDLARVLAHVLERQRLGLGVFLVDAGQVDQRGVHDARALVQHVDRRLAELAIALVDLTGQRLAAHGAVAVKLGNGGITLRAPQTRSKTQRVAGAPAIL